MPTLTMPVANPTQGLDTYSKILGIQKSQADIQTAQAQAQQAQSQQVAQTQSAQATASLDVRKNTEISNLAKFFSNAPGMPEYQNQDGSPNTDKMTADANKIGPTFGQEIIGHQISNIKEGYNAKIAMQNLGVDRAKQIGEGAAALASNPSLTKSDVLNYFEKLKQTNPDPTFSRAIDSSLFDLKTGDSNAMRQQMASLASVFSGFAQTKPTTVETPLGTKPGVVGFRGEFTQTGKEIPKENVITLPDKRQAILDPATNTWKYVGAGNGGGGGNAPNRNGPVSHTADNDPMRPGSNASEQTLSAWENSRSEATKHVITTQQQDDAQGGVGTAINRANTIDRLAKDTRTGPGTLGWQNGIASVAAVVKGHPAQNYQELGMFLDSQATAFQQSMGIPNTNAGMEKAEHIIGSTANDSNAILAKNDLVTGMRLGSHAYRSGLDTIANSGVNVSPTAVNKFKGQWADNFDPNVYTYKWKQGADRATFVKSLPPAEAKSLAKKASNLDKLERGELINER